MRRIVLTLSVLLLVGLFAFALGCQKSGNGDGGGDTGGEEAAPATQAEG